MKPLTYAGLFFVTLAALMHEILLTRIFSVTMFYHFAFLAVSMAMFGMTVGAVWVYRHPDEFSESDAPHRLTSNALLYAVTAVVSFVVYLQIPILDPTGLIRGPFLALSCIVIAVPFVFGGIVVTIALTKFPTHVSRLYGVDLLGAATGCVLVIFTLEITDGPGAILVVGGFAALGSWLFALGDSGRHRRRATLAVVLLAWGPAIGHTILVHAGSPILKIRYARGTAEREHLWERWNSFSRVHVQGNLDFRSEPTGWGLSPAAPKPRRLRQLYMGIDVTAGTLITEFDGDTEPLEYLKYDVTNLAHHVRQDAKVLIVGVGGGRDVLSALVFDQASVVGVEVNENVLRATNDYFGDFSGHLDRDPRVSFVVDEARSYVAGSRDRFDIIQISLVDTWAATAAGAFVLSENALYTTEAWTTFLEHLSETGVLSVSRWHFQERPGEVYRLASLAVATLRDLGVADPREHLVIVKLPLASGLAGELGNGIATLLVSRSPFSQVDLATLRSVASSSGFEFVAAPDFAEDEVFEAILSGAQTNRLYATVPMDLTAPKDDKPFFFQMLRLRDVFSPGAAHRFDLNVANLRAVRTLWLLLGIVVVLTSAFILVPLLMRSRRGLESGLPLILFFGAIGFGFMFIEISQLQRLMIFLGRPTYALSVVLFTLLLAGGLGSLLTQKLDSVDRRTSGLLLLAALIATLVVAGALTPVAMRTFEASTTGVRIAVAVGLLLPMGIWMGMPFPVGMRLASRHAYDLTPWLWGINGAASVCCSVLSVVVAMAAGISTAFWAGVLCYAVALAAYLLATRK